MRSGRIERLTPVRSCPDAVNPLIKQIGERAGFELQQRDAVATCKRVEEIAIPVIQAVLHSELRTPR